MTEPGGRPRVLLILAALAVALGAMDTYVVVLALPEMMAGVGLSIDQLQQAAPIISAFLLGYVALQPLVGRLADLRGRTPMLVAGLVVFAAGSLVTTLTSGLGMLVAGRFLQGVGGGALVPATMALVADLYPRERRAVPLGLISAVQELGSVLGPLVGAVLLDLVGWRGIFAANLVVAGVLAVALRLTGSRHVRRRSLPDPVALLLLGLVIVGMTLILVRPAALVTSITWGELYIPRVGDSDWSTWLGLGTILAALLLLLRCWWARRPLVDLRSWVADARTLDLTGAFWLALVLGGVILAFATADPEQAALSAQGWWYLLGAALALAVLVVHLARTPEPIVPVAALRDRAAWGAVLVSALVGAGLVAALVDIPLFARTTAYSDSQVGASLVLVRLLIAVPVGAVAGGWLAHRLPPRAVAAIGMLLAAAGFWGMTRWDATTLHHASATVPLVGCGLGFGLALAPISHVLLGATDRSIHALASSLAVGARMIGMLVGLSVMTALGLRSYYRHEATLPSLQQVCGAGRVCDAYERLLQGAGITQEHTVFHAAALVTLAAAVLCGVLLRSAPEHASETLVNVR